MKVNGHPGQLVLIMQKPDEVWFWVLGTGDCMCGTVLQQINALRQHHHALMPSGLLHVYKHQCHLVEVWALVEAYLWLSRSRRGKHTRPLLIHGVAALLGGIRWSVGVFWCYGRWSLPIFMDPVSLRLKSSTIRLLLMLMSSSSMIRDSIAVWYVSHIRLIYHLL